MVLLHDCDEGAEVEAAGVGWVELFVYELALFGVEGDS